MMQIRFSGELEMDRLDRKILRLLQEDATLAVADVAKKVGLSTTPCWRRIQKLEEEGVIKRRVAVLDPEKINVRVNVFVSIRTNSHSHEWLRRFSEVIQEFPEVVEFYRMSGDVDYLLRVVVPDIAAYDAFYKRLIAKIEIRDVSSSFAMEQIKYTTEMPLDYMVLDREAGQSAA
jgi:Lrp/AsnC family transcriptional regulator